MTIYHSWYVHIIRTNPQLININNLPPLHQINKCLNLILNDPGLSIALDYVFLRTTYSQLDTAALSLTHTMQPQFMLMKPQLLSSTPASKLISFSPNLWRTLPSIFNSTNQHPTFVLLIQLLVDLVVPQQASQMPSQDTLHRDAIPQGWLLRWTPEMAHSPLK